MKGIECVGAILGGAFLGGAVALLFAPKSGERTRADIKHYFDDEVEKYRDKCKCITDRFKKEVDDLRMSVEQELNK
jgi:gas vesicle protein